MFFLHHMAFLLGQLSLQAALFEISIHIQETVFLHDMAFLLGQLSLQSALFEISIHIQEWFFFIIWPFSWVSLVCKQHCLRSAFIFRNGFSSSYGLSPRSA